MDALVKHKLADSVASESREPVAASPARANQIDSLHGLRFVAAFCILFMHSWAWITHFTNMGVFLTLGASIGVFGMPLFFVLSGFVIQMNYAKLFSTKRLVPALFEFSGARFARLYPLYIVFTVVSLLINLVPLWAKSYRWDLALVLVHIATLTQSWVFMMDQGRLVLESGLGVTWSISTEFFFYLFYPLIAFAILTIRSNRVAICALLIYAAAVQLIFIESALWRDYFEYFGKLTLPQKPGLDDESFTRYLFYLSPWARIFEFCLGCLTARIYVQASAAVPGPRELTWGRRTTWATLSVMALLACVHMLAQSSETGLVGLVYWLLEHSFGLAIPIAVLVFCVSRYPSRPAAALSSAAFVALGEMSYSIYLTHSFVLRPFFIPEPSQPVDGFMLIIIVGKVVSAIVFTLLLSYSTYRWIEQPSRRWLRRRFDAASRRLFPQPLRTVEMTRPVVLKHVAVLSAGAMLLVAGCAYYQFVVLRWIAPHLH